MNTTDSIRTFLFLTLGLTRYPFQKKSGYPLVEPDGVRISRRNIIALAGLLVFAGFAGADPSDLKVFGLKPGEGAWGVIVISTTAVAVQLYWYLLKYCHLKEDGKFYGRVIRENKVETEISRDGYQHIRQKSTALFSNQVAFFFTILSWFFLGCWVCDALSV